jgi:hypothetical protein
MTASRCLLTPAASLSIKPSMSPEKLVYMANQIGKFFAHGYEEKAVEGGGEGLQPIVLKAVRSLSSGP